MTKEERIRELENKIGAVCMQCPHSRFVTGRFQCTVKRSHCHSKRVIKWLKEIEALEVEHGARKSPKDS